MSTITVDGFVTGTIQWAQARNQQFRFNWPVKGGWESWVQVDLTAYLLAQESTLEILREQRIYTGLQKVDLLLNTDQATDDQIPVEIKAESFENRMDPFVQGVRDDIEKLSQERNADFSECTSIMLALPFSQQSLDAVLRIQADGHAIFTSVYIGEVAVAVAVYTERDGWLPSRQSAAGAMRDTVALTEGSEQ